MFVSRNRSIVYPQSEHARLAGAIAQHWGNRQFSRPQMAFDDFCTGVALHDFGYGLLDTHNITGMEAAEREYTFDCLMNMSFNSAAVETVAKMHVARLLQWSGLSDQENACRRQLRALVSKSGVAESTFLEADTITWLCDAIAFDFCLEENTSGSVAVAATPGSAERVDVHYQVHFHTAGSNPSPNGLVGVVTTRPWILSVEALSGYLLAFEQQGYPEVLKPHRVEFRIVPG